MKTIFFGSWMIVLSFMIPFLLIIPGCGNLSKLKRSDLHQLKSMQESTLISQESSVEGIRTTGSVLQNDSTDYWIWFQSDNPFVFHPDKGLEAENGNLITRGSSLQSSLVQENTLQRSNSHKDSVAYESLRMAEKNVGKVLEKERRAGDRLWIWLLGGAFLLWLVFRK